MTMETWLNFAGRLHPMLLHVPIGALVALIALEVWAKLRPSAALGEGQRTLLSGLLFLTAFAASFAGWRLEEELGYAMDGPFRWHKIAALVFLGLTLLAWVGALARKLQLYGAMLGAAAVFVSIAGHFGGELVHGEGFLLEPFEAPNALPVAQPAEPTVSWYEGSIAPFMERYCVSCHGEEKQKGDLALHTHAWLVEGSEFTQPVVPGDSANSPLLERMLAPLDDDDHMPPPSKPQPTPEELEEIQRWIAAGASRDAARPRDPETPR